MYKILLCCNTPGMLSTASDLLASTGSFEITMCEEGADAGMELAGREHFDLFVVNISDLPENSYIALFTFQTSHPETVVMAAGATMEYSYFMAEYVGDGVNQLQKPFVPDTVIPEVGRALGLPNADILQLTAKARNSGRRVILVVDDNAVVLRSIKKMLDDDYDVMVATSGKAALDTLDRKRHPDVILLDYEMPEMDGREVLETIRHTARFSKLKVIFLTGISDREHISAVMGLNPEGYLLKPIAKPQLCEAIEATLKGRNANEALR